MLTTNHRHANDCPPEVLDFVVMTHLEVVSSYLDIARKAAAQKQDLVALSVLRRASNVIVDLLSVFPVLDGESQRMAS